MINFCLYVIIFYAVASSARAILQLGNNNKKRKVRKRTVAVQRVPSRNNIIKLNPNARRGKTPLRVAFYYISIQYTNISY